MRYLLTAALAAMTLALAPAAARAEGASSTEDDVGFRGWGPRLGVTFDPDQFHVGAHMDFGNFARHIRIQPNIEAGFGDDVTLVTANLDAAYRFSDRWDGWTPYLGGGLGLVFADAGDDGLSDDTETDVGASILGGVDRGLSGGDRFFVEGKLGLTDAMPDGMLTVGWTFYH